MTQVPTPSHSQFVLTWYSTWAFPLAECEWTETLIIILADIILAVCMYTCVYFQLFIVIVEQDSFEFYCGVLHFKFYKLFKQQTDLIKSFL